MTTLHELFVMELADARNAENQLLKGLEEMASKAKNPKLAAGFRQHLEETRQQIARLDEVIELCELDVEDNTCEAMQGLIKEAKELMKEIKDHAVLDAALIMAAQKVEHYEIASYGSLCALARCLDLDEKAIDLLEETLEEEKQTDEKLSALAEDEGINEEALQQAA